jgi:cellulose biosynthesis protein BcsQ
VIPNVSSTSGLDMMFTKIALVQRVNPRLRPLGVFAVKVQRTGLHRQMQLMLERQLKELWLDAPVPQTVAIENSEVFHQPVRAYDPLAKAANSYRLLADKLLDRLGREGLLDANERAAA